MAPWAPTGGLQQGVSLKDAEGVLDLVDSVGVRQGLVLSVAAGFLKQ